MRTVSPVVLAAIGVVIAVVVSGSSFAASPPERINFQGVLRDGSGNPRNGSFDMIFRIFDAPTGGNEILVDSHLSLNMAAVLVTNGLFSVEIGGGALSDGAAVLPNDPYMTLGDVFRDFTNAWVEIIVYNGMTPETLNARVRVDAAAYALNTLHLDGKPAASYLNTSSDYQVKAGPLSVDGLGIQANGLVFSSAAPGAMLFADPTNFRIYAGNSDTDALYFTAGNGPEDGRLLIDGGGPVIMGAGDGTFYFLNESTGLQNAVLSPPGNLLLYGGLSMVGDSIGFGGGQQFVGLASGGTGIALTGSAIVGGDLTVVGNTLVFGSGEGIIDVSNNVMYITAGGENTDDLELIGGNGPEDGYILINGAESIQLQPGNNRVEMPVSSQPGALSRLHHSPTGTLLEAAGFVFDPLNVGETGLILETSAQSEGAGLFMNGDTFAIWSPGDCVRLPCSVGADRRLFSVYDEDGMVERFWLDDDGDAYVKGLLLTSSRSRKKNIEPLGGALDKVLRLQGVRFDWKEQDQGPDKPSLASRPDLGFIAEDVAPIFPELVAWEHDGVTASGLSYSGLTAATIEAIKELYALVVEQHPEIAARRRAAGAAPGSAAPAASAGSAATTAGHGGPFGPPAPPSDLSARTFEPSSPSAASLMEVADPVEAGDVLIVDADHPGLVRLSRVAGDTKVLGIIAAAPGRLAGAAVPITADADADRTIVELATGGQERVSVTPETHAVPLSTSGVALCKVDAGYGSIRPGDLLTTSDTPGHAMRADAPAPGTILGKALEPLESGIGLIKVLVLLR